MIRTSHYVPCGCMAHLSKEDPRAKIWLYVFGKLEFPLMNPLAHIGQARREKSAKFLKGDWNALNISQQNRMLDQMKEKFNIPSSVFSSQAKTLGYIPIKDENITVVICALHTRCM